jgi:hypothetical protein
MHDSTCSSVPMTTVMIAIGTSLSIWCTAVPLVGSKGWGGNADVALWCILVTLVHTLVMLVHIWGMGVVGMGVVEDSA